MKIVLTPGGEYSAVVTIADGRTRRIHLYCSTPAEAKERVSNLNLERIEQLAINQAISRELIQKLTANGGLTVDGAVLHWYAWMQAVHESRLTTHNQLCCVKGWMKDMKLTNTLVVNLQENDVERWVNKEDNCKGSTRRYRLSVLRAFLKFCVLKNYLTANVAELVRVKYKDLDHDRKEARVKRLFTDAEYQKVLFTIRAELNRLECQKEIPPEQFLTAYRFWYAAVVLGRHTALRISDIASLEWACIKNGRLVVHTDKKNVRVDLEITPEIHAALAGVRKLSNKYLFPQQNAINSDPATRSQLPVQFMRILKRADVGKHHFHELRITKITELDQNGHTLEQIAEFAGHTSTKSTEGYIVK